jgi:hypothetical protein
MFNTQQTVQILALIIMRRNAIAKVIDNPYTTVEYRVMLEKELRTMDSIEKQLHPTTI